MHAADWLKTVTADIEGISIDDIPVGCTLKVQTKNTLYLIERREDGLYISGNKKYCPSPVKTDIIGSRFAQQALTIKMKYIGIDMYLEYYIDEHGKKPIISSHIVSIEGVNSGTVN